MARTRTRVATAPVPSIPLARVSSEDPPTVPAPVLPPLPQPLSLKEKLRNRLQQMEAAPSESRTATKRPEYNAPPEAVQALRRFIPADRLRVIATKRAEAAKREASEIMMKAFVAALWRNKIRSDDGKASANVPANPKIVVNDDLGQPEMSAIYIVQDRFAQGNMNIPCFKPEDSEASVVEKITTALFEAGVERNDALALMAKEVEVTKKRNIRSLNDLIFGRFDADTKEWVDSTPEEQAVVDKLMNFLDTLTPEERKLIRRDSTMISVKKDFLSNVCRYAQRESQVASILSILVPTNYVSNSVLGVNDDEATRMQKLQQAANEIIGSASPVEIK